MATESYNDNAVQYGSITADIKKNALGGPYTTAAATAVGTFVLENVTLNRPSKVVERSNEVGAPNGWAAQNAQVGGSCVVQMGAAGTNWPRNGNWFEHTFDTEIGVERFVLLDCGQPFEQQGYYKVNATLKRAHFPT